MANAFQWPHLLLILVVIILLFGAAKLPALAKSMGQSARVFKKEIKAMKEDDADTVASTPAETPAPADRVASADAPSPDSPRSS